MTKRLKKWMSGAGVPRVLRGRLPLLADGDRVLWLWGVGFCKGLQPDDGTKRLLEITIKE